MYSSFLKNEVTPAWHKLPYVVKFKQNEQQFEIIKIFFNSIIVNLKL